MRRCVWICALSIVLFSGTHSQAGSEGPTLLVIPSRYTIVQFAFDVDRLRSVYILAYRNEGDSVRSFLWDKSNQEWLDVDPDAEGSLFSVAPSRAILLGRVDEGAIALSELVADGAVTSRVPSLDLKDVANGLHEHMKFRGTEWRWLASRYKLELKDRNADRRRWGRYGPPGGGRMPPSNRSKTVPIPPRSRTQASGSTTAERASAVVPTPANRRQTLVITLPKLEEKGVPMDAPKVDAPVVDVPEQPVAPPEVVEPRAVVEDSILDESAMEGQEPMTPPAIEADLSPEDK